MAKTFRDIVHGYIKLPELCLKIIDTPEFQRLRRLKQLGVACFVFPNATHTRFEHSLGVSHLAGRLASILQTKQPELEISERDVLKLQVAGLVHDVGHGPFSHTYERAQPGFSHEVYGILIWHLLARRLDIPEEIVSFVDECLDETRRRESSKSWMHNLIHHPDGAIDVDRLDYCKRDAHVASVSIDFDLDRILSDWRIGKDGMNIFSQKLAGDILALHRARFMLFDTVYNHRVVVQIDQLMVEIFRNLEFEVQVEQDGDEVIYLSASGSKARELLHEIETRSFTKKLHITGPTVAHYGAGERNPLELVRFEPPLSEAWKDAMLPKRFRYVKE